MKEARSSINDVNGNMGQTKSNRVIVYTPFIDTRKIILIVMHSNQDVNRKMFFSEYCEIETKNLKHLCILLVTCEEIEM